MVKNRSEIFFYLPPNAAPARIPNPPVNIPPTIAPVVAFPSDRFDFSSKLI
jgi:hypothetical protein